MDWPKLDWPNTMAKNGFAKIGLAKVGHYLCCVVCGGDVSYRGSVFPSCHL